MLRACRSIENLEGLCKCLNVYFSRRSATRCKLVELLFSAKAFPTKKDAGVNVVNHILIIFLLENTDIKSPVFMSIEKKKEICFLSSNSCAGKNIFCLKLYGAACSHTFVSVFNVQQQ